MSGIRVRRDTSVRSGWRLYLISRQVSLTLAGLVAMTAAVLVLNRLTMSVGILTSVTPVAVPWQTLLPALVCPLFAPLCPPVASHAEWTSPRAVRVLGRRSACCRSVLRRGADDRSGPSAGCTALRAAGARNLLGLVGLGLIGQAALGWVGWLLPVGFSAFEVLFGANNADEPSRWAWSIDGVVLRTATVVAATLLVTGVLLTIAQPRRWSFADDGDVGSGCTYVPGAPERTRVPQL